MSGDTQRIHFIVGEEVGQARCAGVHLSAAKGFFVDDFIDCHLDERRPPKVGGAFLLDEDRVIAGPWCVGTASRIGAKRHRYGGDAHLRKLREVTEARAALNEQVSLTRQVSTGRLIEIDDGQTVLLGNLGEPLTFLPGSGVGRTASHGHVGTRDEALDAFDRADA